MDPATKFNQIDLSNYVGGLSGSTVNTASDFKAALQYILDNNSGKHFYYGTDHAGTTWYFASDTELSTLSNDSYTCGNGVHNNGTAVQEMFKMNKYTNPSEEIVPGYYICKGIKVTAEQGPSYYGNFNSEKAAAEQLVTHGNDNHYYLSENTLTIARYISCDKVIVDNKEYHNETLPNCQTVEPRDGVWKIVTYKNLHISGIAEIVTT